MYRKRLERSGGVKGGGALQPLSPAAQTVISAQDCQICVVSSQSHLQ